MRRLLSLVLLVLAGLLLTACTTSAGPKVEAGQAVQSYSGGPRLAFEQRSVDFGKVKFNQQVAATFTAKNVGDKPLTIRKVDVKTIAGC